MISILIPYRPDGEHRDRIFEWVLKYWRSILPEAQVSLAGHPDDPFNRGAARNRAFAQSKGDVLIILDADTICPRLQIIEALEIVQNNRAPWVLPYHVYYNMCEEDTEELLLDPVPSVLEEPTRWEHRLEESVAGVLVMPREAFEAVKGYDERFVGWGGEDRAFALALDCLWGRHVQLEGFISHLWHPRGSADFSQPGWRDNARLLGRYQGAAVNPHLMRRLVGR